MVGDDDQELAQLRSTIRAKLAVVESPALRESVEELVVHAYREVMVNHDRSIQNIARAIGLLEVHRKLVELEPDHSESLAATDLLRAVVVLAHASLEDCLRTIARRLLPLSDPSALKAVPFVADADGTKENKFSLSKLAEYRGQTIQQLIDASVAEYLDRWSLSSVKSAVALLKRLEVDDQSLKPFYSQVQALTQRRHRIVHEADLSLRDSVSPPLPEKIESATVREWIEAAAKFMGSLNNSVSLGALLPKIVKQLGSRASA